MTKLTQTCLCLTLNTKNGNRWQDIRPSTSESSGLNLHFAFLAHLWGAYAIPMALSGVRRPSCVVCVHHNYQK